MQREEASANEAPPWRRDPPSWKRDEIEGRDVWERDENVQGQAL